MRYDENNFEEVGELLSTLKRVEPPGDFDIRVRGRIAKGRPAETRRWPMAVARIGVPAAVLIALGGYFGWTNLSEPVNVPVVADMQPVQVQTQTLPVPIPERSAVLPEQFIASREPGKNVAPVPAGPEVRPPVNSARTPDDEGGGSVDFSFPTARRRLPRGLDPDRLITNTNISGSTRQSAVEVLRMLGVSASCSMSGCRVNSVSQNGVAGNSGLKAGDVIESIDGTRLNSATTFGGQFSAASVRVRRDGSALTISLRP